MNFSEMMTVLFDWGYQVFNMFTFDLGDFTVNGWALLFGSAIAFIVIDLIARAFD